MMGCGLPRVPLRSALGYVLLPLQGEHSSVPPLTAVGMLVLFATVEKIPEAIKAGRSIKVQKGNFCAEIDGCD